MLRFILILFLLSGCSHNPLKPDLKSLYQVTSSKEAIRPVILIHGILGAKIRNEKTNKEIWPGSFWKLMFKDYGNLRLKIDPKTLRPFNDDEAYKIFDQVAGQDYYKKIIQTLREVGDYKKPLYKNGPTGRYRRLYIFTYDWRSDLALVAKKLDKFFEKVRKEYNNPELKVDVIAHSMGGLLTRYYARYGRKYVLDKKKFEPTFDGAKKINKSIFIGTPNSGSVKALQSLIMGYSLGLGKIPAEVMLTFPSLYQIIPAPQRGWMIDINGNPIQRDLYDIKTWKKYEWLIFNPKIKAKIRKRFKDEEKFNNYIQILEKFMKKNLKKGYKFHQSIGQNYQKGPLEYIVFGGSCHLSPAKCLVEDVSGEKKVRLYPHQIKNPRENIPYKKLMLDPGDGSVTKTSLLGRETLDPTLVKVNSYFPLKYSLFLCEKHDQLPGNITFQDNLLNIILSQKTTHERFKKYNKSFYLEDSNRD